MPYTLSVLTEHFDCGTLEIGVICQHDNSSEIVESHILDWETNRNNGSSPNMYLIANKVLGLVRSNIFLLGIPLGLFV